jgi:hypothetical protein
MNLYSYVLVVLFSFQITWNKLPPHFDCDNVGDNVVIYCSVSRVVKYMQLLGAYIVISEQKLTKG